MDHLPLPREPILGHIEVPYRCTEPYDGGPFLSYPERHGWEVLYSPLGIRCLLYGRIPSNKELEGFLQNWLYFGLLHEAFGSFGETSQFTKKNERGETVVSTAANLNDCLVRWAEDLHQARLTDNHRVTHPWLHMNQVLSQASKVCLGTIILLKDAVVNPRIWVSLALLADSLDRTLYDVFFEDNIPDFPGSHWRRSIHTPPIGSFILEAMRDNGWCPSDIKRINATSTTITMLYYLGNMQPPRPNSSHTNCTPDECAAMIINSSYRPTHTTAECECKSEFSAIDQVIEVLKRNALPLIQETEVGNKAESTDAASFQIIEGNNRKFTAISHVWAEGLGNANYNEIPPCSLRWVSDMVNKLPSELKSEPMPFWLDTICVPIHAEEMRIRATNMLRKPYQDALNVLVLDSYLYTQESTKISPLEVWARCVCCSWSRRLWTFQEGRLAKNLWFQFADKAVLLEDVLQVLRGTDLATWSLFIELTLAYRGSTVMRNLVQQTPALKHRESDFAPKPDIREMRESLKARAASVPTEEALCLFSTMGLHLELVTGLPPNERMPKFWSELTRIPVGLVFSTSKKKLAQPGLRWAPASFMGELDTDHWYLDQAIYPRVDGFVSPKGLRIQLPGLRFSPNVLLHDDTFETIFSEECEFILQAQDGVWYIVRILHPWHQEPTKTPQEGDQLVLLTSKPMDFFRLGIGSHHPYEVPDGVRAVIGIMTKSGDVPQFAGFKHAILQKLSPGWQEYNETVAKCVETFVARERLAVSGTKEASYEKGGGSTDHLAPSENPENINGRTIEDSKYSTENENGPETLETFIITQDRRNRCQAYAVHVSHNNESIRNIVIATWRNNGKDTENAIRLFGLSCRFQLQMRLRNRIVEIDQTQEWCID